MISGKAVILGLALLSASHMAPRPNLRTLPISEAPAGRYALELRLVSSAKLPLLGTERSVTTTLMLIELAPNGAGWTQSHRVCDVRMQGSSALRLTVPPAFVQSFAERSYPATLVREGDWRYTADMGLEALGFDPAVTGGELPRSADAPGVQDSDGDGEPGASVELHVPGFGRARLFVVQRSHLVLRGTQTAPDRFTGQVDILLQEQRTLGADPGIFRRTPRIRPNPERSGFALVRVRPGTGCAELREWGRELFGPEQR